MKLVTEPRPQELLAESEAIRILCLHERKNPIGALRWLIRTKRLKCVHVGKGIYSFKPLDLQEFIDSNYR